MKVIIDTCAWSQFLRNDRATPDPIVAEVRGLIRNDAVEMIGPVRQELLSGVRPQGRFEYLRDYLRLYRDVPLIREDYEMAAEFFNRLRDHGIQGTRTDLLISAVSVRHGLKILTTDTDFVHYAKHIPVRLHQSYLRR